MAGAGLATVGLVSASLVTTIPQLLLCYSVITGLGFGLMYTPASTLSTLYVYLHSNISTLSRYIPAIVACVPYFTKRRSLALGM